MFISPLDPALIQSEESERNILRNEPRPISRRLTEGIIFSHVLSLPSHSLPLNFLVLLLFSNLPPHIHPRRDISGVFVDRVGIVIIRGMMTEQ